MKKPGGLLVIFITLMGASCSSVRGPADFDSRPFTAPNYNLVLCIDLQSDLSPLAGLVVNRDPNLRPGQHYVVLPFESTQGLSNEDIVSTWGSFSRFTLVTYLASEKMSSANGVAIAPRIPVYGPDDLMGNEASRDPVHLIANGQDRKLVFRYLPTNEQLSSLPQPLQSLPLDGLDAVAVRLPNNAKQFGGNAFLNENPKNELEKPEFRIRYYPGSLSRTNVANLELSYYVEPNVWQNSLAEWAARFFGVIFIPLVTLYYLTREETKAPRKRKVLLWILGGIQVAIIIGLTVLFVLRGASESQLKTTVETLFTVVGGLLTQIVTMLIVKPKPT